MLTFAVVKRKLVTHYKISYHKIRKEIANGTKRDFPKSEDSDVSHLGISRRGTCHDDEHGTAAA